MIEEDVSIQEDCKGWVSVLFGRRLVESDLLLLDCEHLSPMLLLELA